MRLAEILRPSGRPVLAILALAFASGLAGCASTGGAGGASADPGAAVAASNSRGGGLASLFGGSSNPNKGVVVVQSDSSYSTELFLKQGYCPPVQIRAGTEQFRTYERGKQDDPAFIIYQGSMSQTARECQAVSADTLSMRIGVAGRVVAGPKGKAGTATLPIRVAVIKQADGKVFFSQAFKVQVSLTDPDLSSAFTQVFEQVQFTLGPSDRDIIVYVGFDEGAPKARPTS